MSDHQPDSRPRVHGYDYCKCGTLVPTYVFASLGSQCADCFKNGTFAPVREVMLVNKARTVVVRDPTHRKKRWPDKTPRTKGAAARSNLSGQARRAAHTALSHLYPEMFAVLYAMERQRLGLPLIYNGIDLAKAVETYQREHGYSAASTGGPDANVQPAQEVPRAT